MSVSTFYAYKLFNFCRSYFREEKIEQSSITWSLEKIPKSVEHIQGTLALQRNEYPNCGHAPNSP